MGRLLMQIVCWLCAMIFIGISVYAQKSKSPVNFWSTTKVNEDDISDVASYNKANAIMWSVYGLVFIFIGIICFAGYVDIASYSLIIATFFGMPILIAIYRRIYEKYKKNK